MANNEYELTDEQWNQIKDLSPVANTGRPSKDNRLMFNAMLWILRTGSQWRQLPEYYGPWKLYTADSENGVMMKHC